MATMPEMKVRVQVDAQGLKALVAYRDWLVAQIAEAEEAWGEYAYVDAYTTALFHFTETMRQAGLNTASDG